jgi:hypothetical protein
MDAIVARLTSFFDRLNAWSNQFPAAASNRFVGAAIALPSTTVLGIATWLTPSEKGFGTHTQLGLGDCIMMQLTEWPCPMCGMTTTFTLMAHLRPVDAFFTQPFGVVLFSATVIAAVAGVFDLVTGKSAIGRLLGWIGTREQLLAVGLLTGMFGGWLYKAAALHPHVFGLE